MVEADGLQEFERHVDMRLDNDFRGAHLSVLHELHEQLCASEPRDSPFYIHNGL